MEYTSEEISNESDWRLKGKAAETEEPAPGENKEKRIGRRSVGRLDLRI